MEEKEELRTYVHNEVQKQGFDITKINSYSLNKKANGVYQLIIFFGGKQSKSGDRWPNIPIGKDRDTARIIQDIIEDAMEQNEEIDIVKSMRLTSKKPEKESGW